MFFASVWKRKNFTSSTSFTLPGKRGAVSLFFPVTRRGRMLKTDLVFWLSLSSSLFFSRPSTHSAPKEEFFLDVFFAASFLSRPTFLVLVCSVSLEGEEEEHAMRRRASRKRRTLVRRLCVIESLPGSSLSDRRRRLSEREAERGQGARECACFRRLR